jgi:hypothetical protein
MKIPEASENAPQDDVKMQEQASTLEARPIRIQKLKKSVFIIIRIIFK